jgi:hypothetical protein
MLGVSLIHLRRGKSPWWNKRASVNCLDKRELAIEGRAAVYCANNCDLFEESCLKHTSPHTAIVLLCVLDRVYMYLYSIDLMFL